MLKLNITYKKNMENSFLEKVSKLCLKNKFNGVWPCDYFALIPNLKPNQKFIINLSSSNHPGSHFVGIYVAKNVVYYFDSFGVKNFDKNIEKVLKKYKKPVQYFDECIQHKFSKLCGLFCICFLLYTPEKLQEFSSMFDKNNLLVNDKICLDIIVECIKKI